MTFKEHPTDPPGRLRRLGKFFHPRRKRFWFLTLPVGLSVGMAAVMALLISIPDMESRDLRIGSWKFGRFDAMDMPLRGRRGALTGEVCRTRSIRLGTFTIRAIYDSTASVLHYGKRLPGLQWHSNDTIGRGISLGTGHCAGLIAVGAK